MKADLQQVRNVLENGGYIKGYSGSKKRVMDKDHRPVGNISWKEFDALYDSGVIELGGMIFRLKNVDN